MSDISTWQIPSFIAERTSKRGEEELTTKWLYRILNEAGWNPQAVGGHYIVKHDFTSTRRRTDIALQFNGRSVCCIQVRDPKSNIEGIHLRQAIKYAASYFAPSRGTLDPILAICTNGAIAHLLDGTVVDNCVPIKSLDLASETGINQLIAQLNTANLCRADGSILNVSTTRRHVVKAFSSEPYCQFERSIYDMTASIINAGVPIEKAVELTAISILLATSRDNGVLPNDSLILALEKRDWGLLRVHLPSLFGDLIDNLPNHLQGVLWESYNITRNFNLRLDIIPHELINHVYQSLIDNFLHGSSTRYTSEDLALDFEYLKKL